MPGGSGVPYESASDVLPEGALFHWCAPTDDGIVVVDVWETDEQFNRFAQEQIGPFTAQVGIGAPPAIARYDVHKLLAPEGAPASA